MTEHVEPHDGFSADGHLTDESLAILADSRLADVEASAAERISQEDQREHLALCGPCQQAFAASARALEALRDPAALQQPPADLWDRIAAEINEDAAEDQQDEPMASVHQLQPRKPALSRRWIPLAAAAAGALIGGAVVAGILSQGEAQDGAGNQAGELPAQEPGEDPGSSAGEQTPTLLGGATLTPVAADDFSGSAEMVQTQEGSLELTVEVSAAPNPDEGYFEVWLRDEAGTRLLSLGAVTSTDSTTFTVPAGVDLSQYPVVDVSHEHFDGDPSHSGTTLAAGPMEAAES